MFFGVWNKARDNKESIFYAIVTIFLLERVRTAWNRTEREGRKCGLAQRDIGLGQNRLLTKAAFLYALPFLLPTLKYLYRSIEELSWSVPGLLFFKSTWVFLIILIATECFLALIIYNLLKIYIDRMNSAVGLFSKIGRNIWDGSRNVVQAGVQAGIRAGVRASVDVRSRIAGRVKRTVGRRGALNPRDGIVRLRSRTATMGRRALRALGSR